MNFKTVTSSERETGLLAEKLAADLKNSVILLNGALGAGKTTFVKKLAEVWGFGDDVSSPTFSIANRYSSPEVNVIHLDLYRINSEEELEGTGFYEMLNEEATVIIEWADKFDIKDRVRDCVGIRIETLPDGSREFEITRLRRQDARRS